jgi:gliding motility associated protien GldN
MKYLLLLILILPTSLLGQRNILNARSPDEIGQKTIDELIIGESNGPLAYSYVNDRDVLFSQTIWEIIDLNERVNFPLYYPTDTLVVRNERRPLIHYLLTNALDGFIEIYDRDNLKNILPLDKLTSSLKFKKIKPGTDEGIGLERINSYGGAKGFLEAFGVDLGEYTGIDPGLLPISNENEPEKLTRGEYENELERLIFDNDLLQREEYSEEVFDYADVSMFKIKGVWYFDKRQAELKYRPIAIAPVIIDPRSKSKGEEETIDLFWMFYPDTRNVLFEAEAFNEANTSKPVNFDHLINSRRFSAYIYKEDNVYQDRSLKEYIPENALMQLLESERIKEKIRNKEQDMWSY